MLDAQLGVMQGWRAASFACALAAGCSTGNAPTGAHAATAQQASGDQVEPRSTDAAQLLQLYFGGPILTMEGEEPAYAEAVVVEDGRIAFVGDERGAEERAGAKAQRVDLQGHVLLPGFVDAHGHVFMAGIQKLSANLLPPPDGTTTDLAGLTGLMAEWAQGHPALVEKSGWILGFGYDDSQLKEGRHPTAAELDRVSKDVPVLIIHQSGHLAVMNHAGLAVAGYTANTPDPTGGHIRRGADGRSPDGVLEEMAFFGPMFQLLGGLDGSANEAIALAGLASYAEQGFTTAQDGRATQGAVQIFRKLADEDRLTLDVVSYPDLQANGDFIQQTGTSRRYHRAHQRAANACASRTCSTMRPLATVAVRR